MSITLNDAPLTPTGVAATGGEVQVIVAWNPAEKILLQRNLCCHAVEDGVRLKLWGISPVERSLQNYFGTIKAKEAA